jgi:transcriptional regulator with XRE-family HTH domain
MTKINENIRALRKQAGLTQESFAARLGIKRSLLGAYEEGRAEPALATINFMAQEFNISVDSLLNLDLTQKEGMQQAVTADVEGKRLRVLAITVNKDDQEDIRLVPQKAAAGYLNGFSDPEFIADLPCLNIPGMQNGTYRAFEIRGDSMLPIPSGSFIVGQYVDNWKQVKNDRTYIVITKQEGIVYKRVMNQMEQNRKFLMVSDNPAYAAYEIDAEEIEEFWEAKAFISTVFPEPTPTVERLSAMVSDLQLELKRLKG